MTPISWKPRMGYFAPLDCKKDENGGMWFYLPEWICRAYKINGDVGFIHKVIFIIKELGVMKPFEVMAMEKPLRDYYLKSYEKTYERWKKEARK